ncbi:phosphatidylethanolamine-binding protein 4-like [Hyla sarda]|uniref:phosphatidylethanolamine-binding protein 4-like n=1 Tax=Hyla sarda TaxID=327740 RepID=UPI0024C3A837|nr:phosphatidylethanolamine-binding protein 4-like [Hyla sarda]
MAAFLAKLWFIFGIFLSRPLLFFCIPISCDFEPLIGDDAMFCSGNIRVIYPNMGEVSCIYIPNCFEYPDSLTQVWGPPWIKFSKAKSEKIYTLIMVDPDAPSRYQPIYRFWRHWLVSDIPGRVLLRGRNVTGNVLSSYRQPNPPAGTGYHRYQFLLFMQYPGVSPSLLPEEEHLESWDMNAFVLRWILGNPVATTQFMIQHPDHSS